jgi:hypothetical protein
MKRHVTFWSTQFENKTPKAHFINDRCFGEDVASWLRTRLDGQGFTLSEVIQEDYGWGFWADINGDPYWTFVGVMDDSIGKQKAEWLMGIIYDPGLNIVRRLLRKPRSADHLALCLAIDEVLQGNDGVSEVQWWHEPGAGSPTAHPE